MFEKTKKQPDARGWFTLAQMCEAFDVSPQAFSKSIRPLLDEADVKDGGKRGVRIRCRAAIDAWTEHKVAQAQEAAARKADPLMVGDSPALERYRSARAGLAEAELAQVTRELVRVDILDKLVIPSLGVMRSTGDRITRKFGNEAGAMFNEGIDEFAAAMLRANRQLNGDPEPKPTTGEPKP